MELYWISCALCVAISARTATVYCSARPRLFAVLALFALVWALLLPYYEKGRTLEFELLPAYGGFLLVFIGGLLTLEAHREVDARSEVVGSFQKLGLWLFLVIAFPTLLKLPSPMGFVSLDTRQTEMLVATMLDLVGYASISYGVWRLCGTRWGVVFSSLLLIYSAAEIAYTVVAWPGAGAPDPDAMKRLKEFFAVAKLLFTALFCYAVSRVAMTDEERDRGPVHWVTRLLPMA